MKISFFSAFTGLTILATATFTSCQSESDSAPDQETEQSLIESQIAALGFSTKGMYETTFNGKTGYAIEEDIFLTVSDIKELSQDTDNINEAVTQDKHYVTRNRVTRGTTIDAYMDSGFNATMQAAFDEALNRYNELGLDVTFRRTNSESRADIAILLENIPNTPEGGVILGRSAGFPRSGRPASPIVLNSRVYDTNRIPADAPAVVAHEIGHAIGFRHTDFFNRAFSCGRVTPFNNEGDGGIGALYVPGTPRGEESGSWMLACSNGSDRPFTSGDRTALRVVY